MAKVLSNATCRKAVASGKKEKKKKRKKERKGKWVVLSFRKEKVYRNVHIFCLVGGTKIIGSGTANNLQQQKKAAKRKRATLRGSFFLSFVACNFLQF